MQYAYETSNQHFTTNFLIVKKFVLHYRCLKVKVKITYSDLLSLHGSTNMIQGQWNINIPMIDSTRSMGCNEYLDRMAWWNNNFSWIFINKEAFGQQEFIQWHSLNQIQQDIRTKRM